MLDPVDSAEEVNPNFEDVDFAVLRRCGVLEGRGDGMMEGIEGNAVDNR